MKVESKVKAVKPVKSFGTLYLNSKDCPFVKDVSINDEVDLEITLKIRSLRAPDNWDISEKGLKPTDVVVDGIITKIKDKEKAPKAK